MPIRYATMIATAIVGLSASVPAASALEPKMKPPKSLRVASWGGAYAEAQAIAVFAPFSRDSGIAVDLTQHQASRSLAGTDIDWDVADLPAHVVEAACSAGLLEPIDASALEQGADGAAPAADFFAGGLSRCGVASVAWSTVILANAASFPEQQPASLADFFDIDRFPGERALPRSPKYVFELALLADGVAPAEVYKLLATAAGVNRAAARLKTISKDIYWWNTPAESLDIVKSRKAAMTLTYSGRAFMDIAEAGLAPTPKPLIAIWEGQIYDVDMWAIAKASKAKAAALDFVRQASRPDRIAETARWLPYGPMRRSAIALVGDHASLGMPMAPLLPTSQENFGRSLMINGTFWNQYEAELVVRFEELLATGFAGIPDLTPVGEAPVDGGVTGSAG